MEYLSPRAFVVARPHLKMMLADDPVAAIFEIEKGLDGPFSEHVIQKAMKAPGTKPHMAGFEALAWEAAAVESLRQFLLSEGTYHRTQGRELVTELPDASYLHAIDRALYVEIDGVDTGYEGASFVQVAAADSQGDEKRDHIQITLWPRHADRYGRSAPIGRMITVAAQDGEDLEAAILAGVEVARRSAADVPLAGFRSDTTTQWDDAIRQAVATYADAIIEMASEGGGEVRWQDGIKPYLLAKTEGPNGEAAERALLRRGYVRETVHAS
jgi:hypothetical protein